MLRKTVDADPDHYPCFDPARDCAAEISFVQFRFFANVRLWCFPITEVVGENRLAASGRGRDNLL